MLQPGTCMMLTKNEIFKNASPEPLDKLLIADAQQVLSTQNPVTKTYDPERPLTAFIEILEPAVSLIIFGAGNDSIPLVQMANILGWETTVVDGRSNYATRERFPFANRVLVSRPENAVSQINFDARTVAVLMTHNYNYDIAMLRELMKINLPYIGSLGPKKKLLRMLDELQEEGLQANNEDLKKIFGPAGLDIAAETSEEIALSIIAEIKAVLSQKTGTSLREKAETIHTRNFQKITSPDII